MMKWIYKLSTAVVGLALLAAPLGVVRAEPIGTYEDNASFGSHTSISFRGENYMRQNTNPDSPVGIYIRHNATYRDNNGNQLELDPSNNCQPEDDKYGGSKRIVDIKKSGDVFKGNVKLYSYDYYSSKKCKFEKDIATNVTIEDPKKLYKNYDPNTDPNRDGYDEEQIELDQECAIQSGALAWLICPALDTINGAIEYVLNKIVVPLLEFQPLDEGQDGIKAVWTVFRDLANIAFIFIFFAIVFAHLTSWNIDAYTIKKMLPRLVAASILVQFSYLISGLIIDLGNVLGYGISGLIHEAVKGIPNVTTAAEPSGMAQNAGKLVLGVLGVAAVGFVGIGMALLFALGAVVSFAGMVLALVFRHLFLVMMIILSPLAMAAMVLPNTEKFFKFWRENFIRMVLMFPLMTLVFSLGAILGVGANGAANNGGAKPIEQFLASAFPLIAFMLIPFTFRMAGSVVNKWTGLAIGKAGNFGKNLRKGKTAQAIKESKQERALTDFGGKTNKAAKAFYGFKAGGSPMTATGKRKLSGRYDKLMKEQGSDVAAQVNRSNLDFTKKKAAYFEIAQGKNNAATGVDGSNPMAQSQAIKALGQMGGWEELRALKVMKDSKQIQQSVWDDGMRENIGDAIKKAPDLAIPNSFRSANGAKMVEYHGSTGGAAIEAAASDEESRRSLFLAFKNVAESPSLKGRLDSEFAAHMLRKADTFKSESVEVERIRLNSKGQQERYKEVVSGDQFLRENLVQTAAPDPEKPNSVGSAQVGKSPSVPPSKRPSTGESGMPPTGPAGSH